MGWRAAANVNGEKLPLSDKSKSKKPRSFSGITHLPYQYRVYKQRAGWMDGFLKGGWRVAR